MLNVNRSSMIQGVLPEDGSIYRAGVEIDRGYRVGDPSEPTLWITSSGVKSPMGIWRALVLEFGASGNWPVVFDGPVPGQFVEIARWFGSRQPVARRPVGEVLRTEWSKHWNNPFPGEASEQSRLSAILEGIDVPLEGAKRVGLVAVARPADVPATIGWFPQTPGGCAHSAILRSWEDRFGAYLVSLGRTPGRITLRLGVERSPRNEDQRRLLAAEMLAFCPDLAENAAAPNDLDGSSGIDAAVERLALSIEDSAVWSFSWADVELG